MYFAALIAHTREEPSPLVLDQYVTESDACRDIHSLWNDESHDRARARLALHARQVWSISANAEHAVTLVEEAFRRGRAHDAEIEATRRRVASWCRSHGVPDSVLLPNGRGET